MNLERPPALAPFLAAIALVSLGAYVLLASLALAERPHARWGLVLLPVVVLVFVAAAREARSLRRPS